MKYYEFNFYGVYMAPIAPMALLAYAVFLLSTRLIAKVDWYQYIWHSGLFELALYMIILSNIVLALGWWHSYG